jgi:hypothetical protein
MGSTLIGTVNVWLGGNDKDDQIPKFTPDGKFLMQVGKPDTPGGSTARRGWVGGPW